MPVFAAGLLYAGAREADEGRSLDVAHLFQGFREKDRLTPLLSLGGVALAGTVVSLALFIMIGGGSMLAMMAGGQREMMGGAIAGMLLALPVVLWVQLLVALALIYAVPLVMFRGGAGQPGHGQQLARQPAQFPPLLVSRVLYLFVAVLRPSCPARLARVVAGVRGMLYRSYKDLYEPARLLAHQHADGFASNFGSSHSRPSTAQVHDVPGAVEHEGHRDREHRPLLDDLSARRSSRIGKVISTPVDRMKGKIASSSSPRLMAYIAKPCGLRLSQARCTEGSSRRQGGHQVAQKFTIVTWDRVPRSGDGFFCPCPAARTRAPRASRAAVSWFAAEDRRPRPARAASQPSSNSSERRSAIIGGAADIGQDARLFGSVDVPAKAQIETLAGLAPHADHAHVPVADSRRHARSEVAPMERGARRRRHAATLPEFLPVGVESEGVRWWAATTRQSARWKRSFPRRGFVAQDRHEAQLRAKRSAASASKPRAR